MKYIRCAYQLVEELPRLNNNIANLVKKTFQTNNSINVRFVVDKNLPPHIDGNARRVENSLDYIIALNEDMLKKSTQEYILVTMYHEMLHAFLWEEQRVLEGEFEKKYPNVYTHNIQGIHKGKAYSKSQFIINSGHFKFEPYINKLADAIISFNPQISRETALAMAKTGIIRPTELYDWEIQLNQNEREGNSQSQGQKCKN